MKKYYLLLTLFLFCAESSPHKNYVAKLNGEIISLPEFKLQMNKNRAMIYHYFYEKYKAEDGVDFWSTTFKDEIPIEILKKKTLDECIRIKIQQILARENGIIQDISFTAFLENFHKENERRKNAYESQQVIYGPKELTELTYFNYIFSNMLIRLKHYLADNHFKVDDDKIRAYYQNNKVNFLKNPQNKSEDFFPFESVKQNIKFICIDEEYAVHIDSLIKISKLEINKKTYDSIQIQ